MTFLHKLAQRLARLWMAPVISILLMTTCKFPPARSTAPPDGVAKLDLSPSSLTVVTDRTSDFVVVALTSNNDTVDVSVNWTTSGGSISPLNDVGGLQSARYKAPPQPGRYKVFARASVGAVSDSSLVDVSAVPVASVSVSPSANLTNGQTVQLTATPRDSSGNPLSGRAVTWATSSAAVATVNANGLVTGQGAGTATITATSEGQSGSASVTVTVVPVASVSVTPTTLSLTVGQTGQLTATPRDAGGNPLSGRVVTWATSSAAVATLNANGLVTAQGAGTATITATSEGQSGSATVTITVVPVASVSVTPTTLSLTVGQTGQLTATPRDASGNALSGRVVTWSTSSATVAVVNANGLVTAQGAGTATITATSEGKSGTAAVTVTQPPVPVASVSVTPASLSLTVGQTGQLTATPRDASGNPLTGRVVTWTTSSAAVATVSSSGLVTARGAGTATITATSETKSGSIPVTVQLAPVASVSVTPSAATIGVGLSTQLTATCRDASGNILTGRTVFWTTSAGAVATVSTSGLVTVVSVGTAIITANCEGPTATATITGVVVTPSGSYPNEPAGAIVLMDYDTDFGRITNPPWGYSDGLGVLSTGTDPTAPVNPNVVGRVRFDPGCCDGSGPAELITYSGPGRGTPPSGWSRWYVSDWVKFDANFTPHACCQKLFEFYWQSGGDKWLIVKADPTSTGFPAEPRLTAEFAGSPTVNLGGRPLIVAGRWYQYEIIVNRSGRVQLWIREQGGQPESMYDGTIPGFGNPSSEYLFWWWGYGGLGAYSGPTSYINHNHIRVSYIP